MDRYLMIGLLYIAGGFILICTMKKPYFFWEHRKAIFARKIMGDVGTSIFYYIIAALCFFAATMNLLEMLNII